MASVTQVIDFIKAASLSLSDKSVGLLHAAPVSCTLALPHVLNFKSSQTTRLERGICCKMARFALLREDPAGACSDHFAFLAQYAKLTGACLLGCGCSDSCRQSIQPWSFRAAARKFDQKFAGVPIPNSPFQLYGISTFVYLHIPPALLTVRTD
jgi:hypothetical protein